MNEITEGGVSFPNSEKSIPERLKIEDTLLKEKQTQVDILLSLVRFLIGFFLRSYVTF